MAELGPRDPDARPIDLDIGAVALGEEVGRTVAEELGGQPFTSRNPLVELTLEYELSRGGPLRDVADAIFIRRALRDALWHNSLSIADAAGLHVDSMQVEVTIGVPKPERVDKAQVLAVLPHGTGTVNVVEGGLEIPNDAGTNSTVIANAAAVVRLDV